MSTPAQHGMWLTERLGLAATAYHMPLPVRLRGPLDLDRLASAVAAVAARQPVLGSAFVQDGDRVRLVPANRPPVLAVVPPPGDVEAFVREAALAPFDLADGPLVRFSLAPLGPGEHLLLIVAHHLVFDGESKEILLADLADAYSGRATEPVPAFADLADTQAAGIEQLVGPAAEHWSAAYAPAGEPSLPGLRGRGGAAATPGTTVAAELDAAALRTAADRLGATVFEVVLAGLLTLLDRYGDPAPTVSVDFGTRPRDGHGTVGLFVNELPLAVPATGPDDHGTAADQVARVRGLLRAAYPLRAVPLSRAVSGLSPRAALSPVSVSYRRRTRPEPDFAGLTARIDWTAHHHAARNALHVQLLDDPAAPALPLLLHYDPARLDRRDAERIAGHLRALLDGFARTPDAPRHDLDLLAADERDRLLHTWNDTARELDLSTTLTDLVAAQVAAVPDAVAVIAADRTLSYAQLSAEADAIAADLAGRGVGPGDLVAVCLPRTAHLLPALLGVLRTGAAYLPLDPEHPPARRADLLADARPAALLSAPDGAVVISGPEHEPRRVDRDLCYVIYTSGSTGRPKGVQISHANVVNLLHALPEVAPTGPGDVWLAVAPAAFDMSVPELWLPLATGGTTVLATAEQSRDGERLLALLRDRRVTHAHLTPSTWQRLVDAGYDQPHVTAFSGAEALPEPVAAEVRKRSLRLVNLYGPTETTVWSTAAEIVDGAPVTIGRPLANTTAYVLDSGLRLAPEGVIGELCLGGAGVARGYLDRPELTAARFVDTPLGRLYRTGDRVRQLPDGSIEFHGRTDEQVKVRGFRIEPGEVEAHLRALPAVTDAAVAVDGDALVAYLVGDPAPVRLRELLAEQLPAHLVPSSFVRVDELPRNANGKLDRAALAGLAGTVLTPQASPRAFTGLSLQVYEIWREVLGHGEFGPDDDLFDLGGHSLTVTKIAARLRQRLGVDLPLHVFFDTPTISGVVAAAGDGKG
ncbi:amino acid adenylation domain-containing protein [Catellatospora sp. KI3]|uniref:non-ribosomal peptide synthetase n=1 Tax=Catellatospora sp. KI3 TaxID=3041620 RepID=UPI00248217B1|nr:non-ribosomal peptide synthetase [Catellatospora sp. KI3]MDI1463175.1 amino acid adenylation domain-containing protein [Catellatospora sp. KI3]